MAEVEFREPGFAVAGSQTDPEVLAADPSRPVTHQGGGADDLKDRILEVRLEVERWYARKWQSLLIG
jgi:hypothetical protein